MKVITKLESWPSGFTWKEGGVVQVTQKSVGLGLYTTKAKNIEIYDRKTDETIKVKDQVTPIKLDTLIKADFKITQEVASKALVNIVFKYKSDLEATNGRNVNRYVLSYEVE